MTLHHLVPRSLSGDDDERNLVPLCGSGTSGCHGTYENHWRGWRQLASTIRASLTDEEIEYIVERKSVHFLDVYYPKGGKE